MMNDKSCWISLPDMLKVLEKYGTVQLTFEHNAWDCYVKGSIKRDSSLYSHPYYAVKEVYDYFVEEKDSE